MAQILTVVGARPQFIKAASVSRALRRAHTECLVHTGQHYDDNMSALFFRQLGLPDPDHHLGIGSGPHGSQTGRMMEAIEQLLLERHPDWVLVYGDTNSTLAGALAASKLHIPVAHVEAGLRSFNRTMPEEINRVVTDHLSSLLFCPSEEAVRNLKSEGIREGVHDVGDVMADSLRLAAAAARDNGSPVDQLGLARGSYVLVTVHRAENTDSPARLDAILDALNSLSIPVVFPMHPRTRSVLSTSKWQPGPHVHVMEPQGYLDIVALAANARVICTDSGGLQKEAYWLERPCVTLRTETEWVETVSNGWNVLAPPTTANIADLIMHATAPNTRPPLYGEGGASERIAEIIGAC
jgi:UDP-GlcNAc3NAcA epimerase